MGESPNVRRYLHGFPAKGYPAEQISKDPFNISWFGNDWKTSKNTDRFSFKHRKLNVTFNKNYEIILHKRAMEGSEFNLI